MNKSVNSNIIALSSKHVLSKEMPIVYATVHEDGVWEFWADEIIEEKEILVVTLEQIIQIDQSVSKIISLSEGLAAVRNSIKDEWKIISKN